MGANSIKWRSKCLILLHKIEEHRLLVGGAYFPKVLGNILYMMHIGVLSTKIGVFCKNFALKFVTLQTNFGKFFFEFWRNLENICSLLLVSTKHFSAKSQKLKFPKNFHKIFHEIFHDFFSQKNKFKDLAPRHR